MQRLAQKRHVLDRQGLVQPKVVTHARDFFVAGFDRQQQAHRVAGQTRHDEHDRRHDQQRDDGRDQSPDEIPQHRARRQKVAVQRCMISFAGGCQFSALFTPYRSFCSQVKTNGALSWTNCSN